MRFIKHLIVPFVDEAPLKAATGQLSASSQQLLEYKSGPGWLVAVIVVLVVVAVAEALAVAVAVQRAETRKGPNCSFSVSVPLQGAAVTPECCCRVLLPDGSAWVLVLIWGLCNVFFWFVSWRHSSRRNLAWAWLER